MSAQQRAYPAWLEELRLTMPTAALFCLSGNVRDRYLDPQGRLADMPRLLRQVFGAEGISEVAVVRAGAEASLTATQLEHLWECAVSTDRAPYPEVPLDVVAEMARLLISNDRRALVVLDASRAVTRPDDLSPEEVAVFRTLRRATEDQEESLAGFNPLVWVVDRDVDVPAWLVGANPRSRSIAVPLPSADERSVLAERLLRGNLKSRSEPSVTSSLVDQTEGLPLRSVRDIVTLAQGGVSGELDIDAAVRLFKLGVADNPWRRPLLANRLRNEVSGEGVLGERVRGQNFAVEKALDVMVRSVTGLRSGHSSSSGTKPRGILFFAGPTGVGKTELAKSLTELLFGDETAMIRFDMSEFASAQSAERLVGAPPGYVGFAQGGELTNAVRQRPFSLLLFDEIEKAHHSVLDRFLQLLDDGRLTDGRGQTTYFTETVIVFTSNLGIYDSVLHPVTGAVIGRELAVNPDAPYDELADLVAGKVRDHFTSVVGRPELLNRIGDNIVVFDFIRPRIATEILDRMLIRLSDTYQREKGAKLQLSEAAREQLSAICMQRSVMMMGGRGIGNTLETALIDPLARWTFSHPGELEQVTVTNVTAEAGRYFISVEVD